MDRYTPKIAAALSFGLDRDVQAQEIEIPPDSKLGDFAYPCFRLAKEFRKAPPAIAAEIAEKIKDHESLKGQADIEVQAVGPYVNFTIPPNLAYPDILKEILDGDPLRGYGYLSDKTRGRWVLEFSSPNVAKPFHVGHMRNTLLGAALGRIGDFRGFDMVKINHLGDWGTQYGKLVVAMELFGDELPEQPGVNDLVNIYVKFHQEAEKDPSLEDRARAAFLALENGDPKVVEIWKKSIEISMKEFDRIYARLNVKFDHVWGESHYQDQNLKVVEMLKETGLAKLDDGAWIIPVTDVKGNEIAPCIIQKKDGATIYATRDLAAALYRYEKLKFDRMSYVVGQEQRLHFEQIFSVLRQMKVEWIDRCEHIWYGLYRFKEGKLSTRKGRVITTDEVLQATEEAVAELLESREMEMSADQKTETIQAVAQGAITFYDLSTDPNRDVVFDLKAIVDFEGETGPYMQYAHTRCLSILRKAKESEIVNEDVRYQAELAKFLTDPHEIQLVKMLGRYPYHLERVIQMSKPSQLCNYLIEVTKSFNQFYRQCRVLGDDQNQTLARLMLVEATRRILASGMTLLGMPLPQKM